MIINNLLSENNYNQIIKIIKSYKVNISIKDIELLAKIDKTNLNKIEFKSKQKKIIQKIIKGI